MVEVTPINDFLGIAGWITRADIAALAQQGYRTIINNRPDGEEPGQLTRGRAQALRSARAAEPR
jgi:uncharacterized protein (TIGR01244 family)